MEKSPTPGEIVIMASGAVALIFSFFDFFDLDAPFGGGVSAWSGGLFPLATYIAIIGVIMGAVLALERFADVKLPERILSFTWPQIHLALGFFAFLIGLGYLIIDSGAYDKAIGFWLMFIASIGLLVGAVLLLRERTGAASAGGSSSPPTA